MSLSRILNDEPSPALSARSSYTTPRTIPIDAVQRDVPSPAMFLNASPRSQSHYRSASMAAAAREQSHSRNAQHGIGVWEHYPGSSSQTNGASPHPSGSRSDERDMRQAVSPTSFIQVQIAGADNGGDIPGPRKRHKADNGDGTQDHIHRVPAPEMPPDGILHQGTPIHHFFQEQYPPPPRLSAEEEARLASSDLEDCEEIWKVELIEYAQETQRRFKQVENWFHENTRERTAKTAEEMSHYYSRKIVKIPLPPASPLLGPNDSPSFNGYEYPDVQDDQDMGPEDDMSVGQFPEPPPPPTITATKPKRSSKKKRSASEVNSDISSGLDEPLPREPKKKGPAAKKRKLDTKAGDAGDALDNSLALDLPLRGGKAKAVLDPDTPQDAAKPTRKKPGPRKKAPIASLSAPLPMEGLMEPPSQAASVAGDITPSISLCCPLKRAKRLDDAGMMKRVKTLEEQQRKVWSTIARRDVAKVYKYHALGHQAKVQQAERIAKLASIQARKPFSKTPKMVKDTQAKAKRLMREMQVFWKKNEREERDVRKREHKEAMDRMKAEEEKREAARQARKLEFLISQTELYSHFVGNKLKTSEVEGEAEATADAPAGAELEDVHPDSLTDINFDDEDKSNLYRHARHNAQEAIAMAKQKAQEFDVQAAMERKNNEAKAQTPKERDDSASASGEAEASPAVNGAPLVDLDSDELNFQNPTSLNGPLTIGQPKMLTAQLKEYQLKGLNWLATLYEQGINGILADEMGLGKTVQSISLLSYLAETHDIWGPFLVVAPASTLHNWQQELTRFVPQLKALPYWGNVKDRATLRKFWSKKEISYNQDAPFHVLITSYQLVTQDQQYFQRVKWQYMILDEAQNIKNSASVRWKTLLGFHCRNRLLLTGTPIQNSMQELWALLHFIMPSLFDSHDEFNEWFSKDIENAAADNKGSKLSEHQLRRLHMILKPFMLRRVKKHVQNELSEKIEIDIFVSLSARQRALYKALLSKISVADLLVKAANIGDAESARTLMNLVMQFRKVCNHPELFERADVVAPFAFSKFGRPGPLSREGDFVHLPYSTRNPIEFSVPALLTQDDELINHTDSTRNSCLSKMMNIWSTEWIHRSLYESEVSASFSFLRLLGVSPQEAHSLHVSPLLKRRLLAVQEDRRTFEDGPFYSEPDFSARSPRSPWEMDLSPQIPRLPVVDGLPDLYSILSRHDMKWYIPDVVAPPISFNSSDRVFTQMHTRILEGPSECLALYGAPSSLRDRPESKRLIYDSAKLARLDTLLQELKSGDHRVLVYFQMTRMMDLMEEYLIYRQYKYLRLDGSSKLEDRRDMVIDWQTKPEIFVFLLSTRAGGLGINLTAADTVVFYDHDWNPSNDAQAMDRAHRLGQTRQVTVYRLITKGTIDERIIQLARVKKDVQDIVVGNKNLTDVAKPSEIVQLLLNDDQFGDMKGSSAADLSSNNKSSGSGLADRDLWDEEGDDFFGHTVSNTAAAQPGDFGTPSEEAVVSSTRGKKRKPSTRGRKPGGRRKGMADVDLGA
ncbi:hypothetical protein BDZ89DRAFT_1058935 [Hymenopellis radicata]|nr:hypothetical protein BDZ89DRAFT_1058935 [Hymenopellis radicata]